MPIFKRILLLLPVLLLSVSVRVSSASKVNRCEHACRDVIGACITRNSDLGDFRHACRTVVLKRCRRLGPTVCLPTVSTTATTSTTTTTVPSCGTIRNSWGDATEFIRPFGVAIDTRGNVFVTDIAYPRIVKFDANGALLMAWGTPGVGVGELNDPLGIAIDASEDVFVADTGNNRIAKFGSQGTFLTEWMVPANNDTAVAVDPQGNVFVTDDSHSRVLEFDNGGNVVTTWGAGPHPSGIAIDGSGNVFITDATDRIVRKFDHSGNILTGWGGQVFENNGPTQITIDPSGNVFVIGGSANIYKFDNGGAPLAKWTGAAFGRYPFVPWGIAADASGNVFVTDPEQTRVYKFSCP